MSPIAALRYRWLGLSPRDRRAVGIGALVLFPIVAWTGAARPYLGMLDEARAQLDAERALLAREVGLLASANELPEQLEQSMLLLARESDGLMHAENALLAEARLSDIMQDLAARSRVLIQEVRSIENDPTSVAGGIHTARLGVRAESDLEGVASFLNRLEGGTVRMRVLELSVQPVTAARNRSQDDPDPTIMGALSFSFIVEAYWSSTAIESVAGGDPVNTRLTGIPR